MSVDQDDIQVLVGWIAIKTSNPREVADELELKNINHGSFDDVFIDGRNQSKIKKGDLFLGICHDWSILFYDTLSLGDGIDDLLLQLSLSFEEAQLFLIDTEYSMSIAWKLARNGVLIRSFSWEEEIEYFGEITDAEDFIDWEK